MFFLKRAGDKYIQRVNPTTADFVKTDFTWDNTLRSLDLSSIIPANAKRVDLLVIIQSDTVVNYLGVCPANSTNVEDMLKTRVLLINTAHMKSHSIYLSTPQTIKYIARIYSGIITAASITIIGWWV